VTAEGNRFKSHSTQLTFEGRLSVFFVICLRVFSEKSSNVTIQAADQYLAGVSSHRPLREAFAGLGAKCEH
jgi:hypothetical protein